ncbi:MAG: hypothetical protein V4510_13110, partial [bacterium]
MTSEEADLLLSEVPSADEARIAWWERKVFGRAETDRPSEHASYWNDPVAYATDILKVEWWSKQRDIAEALLRPPYKVLVKAGHSVGKTHLAAGVVDWWYSTRNPSIALTTAPTARQVEDLLWKEIRVQRSGRGGFRGPKIPRLEDAADHFAHGFTAKDADAFQGHHGPAVLIVFDEAVGVDRQFWETAKSMFAGVGHAWLAIFNPTDQTSQAYIEEMTGDWTVITMSCLDHPNVAAELAGGVPLYPAAVRLGWLQDRLKEWCTPLQAAEQPRSTDVEFPPASGKWLRPGPIAEARLLGRWPSQGTYGVWSDALWQACERSDLAEPNWGVLPQIGCDVARFGDDWTSIHVRRGNVSLHHESVNGWGTDETAGRLKALCRELADYMNSIRPASAQPIRPEEIPVKVDDDGVGGGVIDQRGDFCFIPVSAAGAATYKDEYPNRRSELWFAMADRARQGNLSLARLPQDVRNRLRQQAMAPKWKMDGQGRRVVEKKEDTKKELGRSPDDMDGANLAYFESVLFHVPDRTVALPTPGQGRSDREPGGG